MSSMRNHSSSHRLASRGTTCWYARLRGETEFSYVVKDAWRSSSYVSEGVFLLAAQTAGVEGIVKYFGHEDIQVNGALNDISSINWRMNPIGSRM